MGFISSLREKRRVNELANRLADRFLDFALQLEAIDRVSRLFDCDDQVKKQLQSLKDFNKKRCRELVDELKKTEPAVKRKWCEVAGRLLENACVRDTLPRIEGMLESSSGLGLKKPLNELIPKQQREKSISALTIFICRGVIAQFDSEGD